MRTLLFMMPIVATIGCHPQQATSGTTVPASAAARRSAVRSDVTDYGQAPGPDYDIPARTLNQVAREVAAPGSGVVSGQRPAPACQTDADCQQQQLCAHTQCIPIRADLAECSSASVFFGPDSADLGPTAQQGLEHLARCLKAEPSLHMTVLGSADPTDSAEYDLDLSESRANAVIDYLIGLGIAPGQLRIGSYGSNKLQCQDQDQDCLAKNRRVQIQRDQSLASVRASWGG